MKVFRCADWAIWAMICLATSSSLGKSLQVDHLDWVTQPISKDDLAADKLSPIKVQAVLAEGLGWEGTGPATQTSLHVVISVTQDPEIEIQKLSGFPIPSIGIPIQVKAFGPLECSKEAGVNDFERCSMSEDKPHTFTTNALGRVSFSIPLEDQLSHSSDTSEYLLPPIMIRTENMGSNEW